MVQRQSVVMNKSTNTIGNLKHDEKLRKTLADFVIQRRNSSDLFSLCDDLYESIEYKSSHGHHLYGRVLVSSNANYALVEDSLNGSTKEMIMMGSNSYLGLHVHPRVINAAKEALEKYGIGAGSPPLFSGYYDVHRELESNLSKLKATEDTIIYPSGYATNVGVISALLGKNDTLILDKLSHASIIDGGLLSRAKFATFRHNDMESLERTLKKVQNDNGDKLVVVEGVYSMDGDIAPLDKIHALVKKYNCKLMIDEAHATGVLGKTGKGSLEHFNLEGKVDLVMGTFSKALGGIGGYICAKKEVIRYLRYYSHAYFFAASLPPMQVAAQNEALQVLLEEPQWHKQLWENIEFFHTELRSRGFNLENSQTAITPVVIGDTFLAQEVTKFLYENGVFVNCVPYPAVPRSKDRLRFSLSALHTKENLSRVIELLTKAAKIFNLLRN